MNGVFLVESPLQVLNAIEARHHFEVPNASATLLIMVNPKYRSPLVDAQIESAVQVESWGQVHQVVVPPGVPRPITQWVWYLAVCRFLRTLSASVAPDFTFIGNYEAPAMLHAVNQIRAERNVVLDDGTLTIAVAKRRRTTKHLIALTSRRQRLLYSALGLNIAPYKELTFFSSYDLRLGPEDVYVPCEYSYLRRKLRSVAVSGYSVFLGNPIVELGVVSIDAYLSGVRRAVSESSPSPLQYLAHRREDRTKLMEIERELGVLVSQPRIPFEVALLRGESNPRRIFSFYSSALFTSSLLIQDKARVTSIRLDDSVIALNHRTAVKDVYRVLSESPGISTLRLSSDPGR